MIVGNQNVYNYSDYKHPILFTNTDYRTSTHLGHSQYSLGTVDSLCDHQPVSGRGKSHAYDYGTQFNRFHGWKNGGWCGNVKYNLPMRLNRVDFMRNLSEKTQLRPVSAIEEYHTIQKLDYDWKHHPDKIGKRDEKYFVRQPLKPIFRGYTNDSSFHKFTDPYLTSQTLDFSLLASPEELKISQKDNITVWDWLRYPKTSKGYGLKDFPEVKPAKMNDSLDRFPLKFKRSIQNNFTESQACFIPPKTKYMHQDVISLGQISSSAPRDKLPDPESQVYGSTTKSINLIGLPQVPRQRR